MDCSEANILIFNLQRKCKKNCRGSCGDSRWCREVWGRSHASQFFLYVLISDMMFSREFAFCLFINYAYICMWMHVHKQDDNWKKQFSGVPSRGLTEMEIQAKKFFSFFWGTNPKITIESIENLQVVIGVRFWEVVANESLNVRGGGGTPNSKWRGWTNGKENQNPNHSLQGFQQNPKNPSTKNEPPKIPCRNSRTLKIFQKHFKLSVLYDLTNNRNRWLGSAGADRNPWPD